MFNPLFNNFIVFTGKLNIAIGIEEWRNSFLHRVYCFLLAPDYGLSINNDFSFCLGQYIAIFSFIGPSEWQPGGRRTLLHRFFRELLLCIMGRMLPYPVLYPVSHSKGWLTGYSYYSNNSNLFFGLLLSHQ